MRSFLKPMGIRDVLDSSFSILRSRFWTFQGVIFWSFLPSTVFLLLGLGFIGLMAFKVSTAPFGPSLQDSWFWSELFEKIGIFGIIFLLMIAFLMMVTMMIGSMFFMHGCLTIYKKGFHGEKCTTKEALFSIKTKWLWYIVYFVLLYVVMIVVVFPLSFGLGIVSVFAPFFVQIIIQVVTTIIQLSISFFFCLGPVIIANEDGDVLKAFIRSFKLPAKHRWRMFGTLLVVYLSVYAIYLLLFGLAVPPIILAVTLKHLLAYILAGIGVIAALFVLSMMMPFYFGPLTAIYYDLIIRKEGYDLQLDLNQTDNADSTLDSRSV